MSEIFATLALHTLAFAAFGLAGANDTQAEVPFGCRKPEDVPDLQEHVLKSEGMVPVVARFLGIEVNGKTEWIQDAIMLNPKTREGLSWSKFSNGTVCIGTKYSDIRIYNNRKFDTSAWLEINGHADPKVEINAILTSAVINKSWNPMFRAIATTPTNVAIHAPISYVEFMVGNYNTQGGAVYASTLDGGQIKKLTKWIPSPKEAPVKFGAIYTRVGEDLIRQQAPP